MPGFKSRMVNFMIRYGHLMRGKLRKEVFTMETSIPAFRERCEKWAGKYGKLPAGVMIRPQLIEGMDCEWHIPEGSPDDKLIMYVHGGGYVSGSCNDHRGFVAKFADYTGFSTLIYEYRLAPEHPFPAALNDSLAIYRHLLHLGYKPENIVMAGESAGGGLCLAILLALKQEKLPQPAATVAISPWTDLTCSGESYKTKNHLSPAPLNSWNVFARHYAGEISLENPLISPLFGDLEGLSPIYINSGSNDELYDDGEAFARKATKSGVDTTFQRGDGMLHCYPLLAPLFPEATEAMNEIASFIGKSLSMNRS